jgi:hypothetical protein
VQVLDEQHRRGVRRRLAEELDPGLLKAVAHGERMRVAREVEAESEPEDLPLAEPPAHFLLRLALEDSQLLAQDLSERPVGEVAIGETPAGALNRLRSLIGEPAPELLHQRRLPDAGVAHQRHDVWLALFDRVAVDRLQQLELRASADEGSRAAAEPSRTHQGQRTNERLRQHGLGLPLRVEREWRSELEGAAHCLGGSGTDDGRPGLGCLLEPRGDVDRIAGDEGAAVAGLPGDDLAGVHADAKLEPALEHDSQALVHRERGVQGPLGVVLQRLGHAEHSHDRVARELLDRPTGTSDLVGHGVVEALEQDTRPLRILGFAERRRADEVGEQHSGQLPLGGPHAPIVTSS